MKIIFLLAALLFSFQANAKPSSAGDFDNWIQFYYLHPEPDSIAPALDFAVEAGLLNDVRKSGPAVFGFIAGAVRRNPELAARLIKQLDSLGDAHYALLLIGIWYADLPDWRSEKLVSGALQRRPSIKKAYSFLAQRPSDLLKLPIERGAWILDAWWGYFMATGDSKPVLNIISVLPWLDESRKSEVLAMGQPGLRLVAAGGAANWSLTANARKHKRVLQICEEQIDRQPEPIPTQLRKIVHNVKSKGVSGNNMRSDEMRKAGSAHRLAH